MFLDLDDDFCRWGCGGNSVAKGSESIERPKEAVDLPSSHDLVDQALRRSQLKGRESQKDAVEACLQLVDPLVVGPKASNKVFKRVVGVALTGLHTLQDDHAALQCDGEGRQFDMSTELPALFADARKRLSYRGAVVSAISYGLALIAWVNLNRFRLYEALRLRDVDSADAERAQNSQLVDLIHGHMEYTALY